MSLRLRNDFDCIRLHVSMQQLQYPCNKFVSCAFLSELTYADRHVEIEQRC